jgi:signal transduction histidine kinase
MSENMNSLTKNAVIPTERAVLLGTADENLVQQLTREVLCHARTRPISIASTLPHLRELSSRSSPAAIVLDDELVGSKPLAESLRNFTEISPVVLLASVGRHAEVTRLVAEGQLEFVARVGDFVPLAASLIERRLRWMEASESVLGPPWAEFPGDIGEIFRHEINNPLTGILGNAELLLARHENLSIVQTQRLQTVVDLAVRLRETVRRLSNACDRQPVSLRSA